MYSTRLHMYTRASLTDILVRKSARVGQVGGQVGDDRRACPARGKLNIQESRRTRRHPRDDHRAEVGEDVGVRVCPMEFQLMPCPVCCRLFFRSAASWQKFCQTLKVFFAAFILYLTCADVLVNWRCVETRKFLTWDETTRANGTLRDQEPFISTLAIKVRTTMSYHASLLTESVNYDHSNHMASSIVHLATHR